MPSTSLFLSLRLKWNLITNGGRILNPREKVIHGRFFSSAASGSQHDVVAIDEEDESHESGKGINGDDLRSRILRLRLPKRSATNIIDRWIGEGNPVTSSELRAISRELRKSQRYKHALEISEWMVSREGFEVLDSDYATRIDLMTKVFGIDAAERYFESLPPAGKTAETYTALLHSYAGVKMIDKAEELYERMKESENLCFTAVTYNEMMTLYMSVGKLEKVASVVQELKDRNVAPDIFTYNLWISSCAANLDIDEARRVLDEMSSNAGCNDDWLRYIRIANLYVMAGHIVNGETGAVVEADKSITQREWITYDFLIILYAGLQNKERIDQIWKSLRLTKQKMTSRNYVCVLSSYLVLGHLKEAGEVIDQWKNSTETEFDASACSRLLDALSGDELTEVSTDFRLLLIERNCDPTNSTE